METNTPGTVNGGGVISSDKESVRAVFGFTIYYHRGDYAPKGNLVYQDRRLGFHLKASSFDLLLIDGPCAWFTGTGTVDDLKTVRFTVELAASPDKLNMYIPDLKGYEVGGRLSGGNLTIQ